MKSSTSASLAGPCGWPRRNATNASNDEAVTTPASPANWLAHGFDANGCVAANPVPVRFGCAPGALPLWPYAAVDNPPGAAAPWALMAPPPLGRKGEPKAGVEIGKPPRPID